MPLEGVGTVFRIAVEVRAVTKTIKVAAREEATAKTFGRIHSEDHPYIIDCTEGSSEGSA